MTDKGRNDWITAGELMAELEADPEFVAQREQRDRELLRREREWREAEEPLIRELHEAGFLVDSAWDLVNTSTPYPQALPILLAHLERPYPDRVREGIARALAVRDSRFAWETLVRLYRDETPGTDAKDGLAVALAAAADDGVIEDVIGLVQDERHGESRILLSRALAKSKRPEARAALAAARRRARPSAP